MSWLATSKHKVINLDNVAKLNIIGPKNNQWSIVITTNITNELVAVDEIVFSSYKDAETIFYRIMKGIKGNITLIDPFDCIPLKI